MSTVNMESAVTIHSQWYQHRWL